MCIVICHYHATVLVNNKNEGYVTICQQFKKIKFNVILEKNLKCLICVLMIIIYDIFTNIWNFIFNYIYIV